MKTSKISTYISLGLSLLFALLIGLKLIELRNGQILNAQKAAIIKQTLLEGPQLMIGQSEAPYTLIVYYSYDCKYSRAFFHNNYPSIKEELIQSGQLNMVLKPVLLTADDELAAAYNLLYSLNTIGIFEHLHDVLIQHHDMVYSPDFIAFQNELIMENDELAECLARQTQDPEYLKNKQQLKAVYKNAVPVFIINNRIFKGKISLTEIEKVIARN